jgi:hypothetical protein
MARVVRRRPGPDPAADPDAVGVHICLALQRLLDASSFPLHAGQPASISYLARAEAQRRDRIAMWVLAGVICSRVAPAMEARRCHRPPSRESPKQ